MPATRSKITSSERSSSETSVYTSSGLSYGSTDSDASSSSPRPAPTLATRQRRTRRRISESQLAALETLFGRATHPSQAEREVLAKSINMEVKNVTIWFQNRRQAARKLALHEAITHSNSLPSHLKTNHGGDDFGPLAETTGFRNSASITPEQVATPLAGEEPCIAFGSSTRHSSLGLTTTSWRTNGSPRGKGDLDQEMLAAALALAQMRSVDSPVA